MSYLRESCTNEKAFKRGLVLVVIDDHSLRDMVYTMVEDDGYDVLAARSCVDGLRIFQRSVRPIDLLLTASATPGMTTVELAHQCSNRSPNLAVIFISGNAPEKESRGALPRGRWAFLSLPFCGEDLLRGVRALLAPGLSHTLPAYVGSMSDRLERR